MVDPATGWIEICTVPSACIDLVPNTVELAWFTRNPLPSKVIVDCGNKFLAEFKTMIQANNGITVKSISSRNTQTNSILERGHQTIGNIILIFKVQDMVLDDEEPLGWTLSIHHICTVCNGTYHNTVPQHN